NNKIPQRLGGRIHTIYNSGEFLLDSEVSNLSSDNLYYLSVLTPSFNYEHTLVDLNTDSETNNIRRSHVQKRTISPDAFSSILGEDGATRSKITLDLAASIDVTNYSFTGNPVWILEGYGINHQYYNTAQDFRVLSAEEYEDNKYNISAIQYA